MIIQYIQEYCSALWKSFLYWQKVVFVLCCLILPIELGYALFFAEYSKTVVLIESNDNAQVESIRSYLDTQDFFYELNSERVFLVKKRERSRILLNLASEGLIRPNDSSHYKFSDPARVGMTKAISQLDSY